MPCGSSKEFWDRVLVWGPWVFNFGLVAVGILQVVLLKRTWKTIERQANIQAAGMKQWVAVDVISSSCTNIGSKELDRIRNEADKVNIWFSASNETSYSLKIKEVFVKTSVNGSDGPAYKGKEEVILSPSKGREGAIGKKHTYEYQFVVVLNLDQAGVEEYIANKLHVSVSGYVLFQPAIGEIEKQTFGYVVSCGPGTDLAREKRIP